MTDETLSTAPELETPASPAAVDPANDELGNEQAAAEQNAEIEEDDFEWEGRTLRVPKALKERFEQIPHMDADYTRKSQANSARAKELDEREQRIAQQAEAGEEELSARATLHHLNSELKRFENWGWQQYQAARQQDPIGADEAWNYVQHLKAQQAEATNKISEAQWKRTQDAERDFASRTEQARAHASKLPGWTAQSETQIVEFARAKGISDAQFASLMSPAFVEILHKARLGEIALSKPAPKPVSGEPPAQPLKTVTSKSNPPPAGLDDRLSTDEWIKRRNAQVARAS